MTVTGVETSPDLRQATVFVSVLGTERKRTATLAGLAAAHGVLQARLARELRMKRTPQLTFEYDPTVERGVRMTQLIDELAQTTSDDLKAVAGALRSHDRFLLVTHENPDGDALGSLLAAKLGLESLGKDTEMYLYGDAPLPKEYGFMPLDDLLRELPADAGERVVVALDCANADRIGQGLTLVERSPLTLDIDHHHDNTRFGDVTLVVPDASSTGEVLRDVFAELDVELTPEIAQALLIAVVTDTGRFQYTNTTPKAFRLAAELVEAGADVHRIFQALYESIDFIKFKLIGKAAERAQVLEGGRLVISYLERRDFTELGAAEAYAEGVIDSLRAIDGAEMVALIREPPRQRRRTRAQGEPSPWCRRSCRSRTARPGSSRRAPWRARAIPAPGCPRLRRARCHCASWRTGSSLPARERAGPARPSWCRR